MWIYNGTPELEAHSRYPMIIGSAMATTVIMVTTVLLRFYVRARLVKQLGSDDWCILASVIGGLTYTCGGVLQTRYGLGLPTSMYPLQNIIKAKELNYTFRGFYTLGVTGFKIALCFTYLRVTTNSTARSYRILIWMVLAFTLIFGAFYAGLVVFACVPSRKYWIKSTPGHCLPFPLVYISPGVVTIITDVVLFILPLPLLSGLQMRSKRKAGLICAFLLGLLTTLCSIMRLVGSIKVVKSNDPQELIMWAIAEINVGIITSLLPTLAPLLKLPRLRLAKSSTKHSDCKERSGISDKLSSIIRKGNSERERSTGTEGSRGHMIGHVSPVSHEGSEEDILDTSNTRIRSWGKANDSLGPEIDFIKLADIVKTINVDVRTEVRTESVDELGPEAQCRYREY